MAELAGTANGSQTKQLDVRRKVFFAHRFFVHQRGAQILLVVVAEDGDDGSVWRDFALSAQGRTAVLCAPASLTRSKC